MTTTKILALVAELIAEEAKTELVPVYYKRNGKLIRRSYDDRKVTARYTELNEQIRSEKVFRCPNCGRKVDYFSLERWACNFPSHRYICSSCYENEMGEDL